MKGTKPKIVNAPAAPVKFHLVVLYAPAPVPSMTIRSTFVAMVGVSARRNMVITMIPIAASTVPDISIV